MRMMALPLGTFLGGTQPATHHGESKGFLKVVWCCGMYMQIFQCVSGSPYLHWQAMPAVARSSIETRLCRTLFFVELPCERGMNVKKTLRDSRVNAADNPPCTYTRARLHTLAAPRARHRPQLGIDSSEDVSPVSLWCPALSMSHRNHKHVCASVYQYTSSCGPPTLDSRVTTHTTHTTRTHTHTHAHPHAPSTLAACRPFRGGSRTGRAAPWRWRRRT
jgi:hypothetical protein